MIVDWYDNCNKIYTSGKLKDEDPSDNKIKFKQEVIYLRYLTYVKKLTKEECFQRWRELSNGSAKEFEFEFESLLAKFNYQFRISENPRYKKVNLSEGLKPVSFYQEEVDFINGLEAPLWVKQYWAALLYYYKFESQNNTRVQKTKTLNSWCIRQTNFASKNYGGDCQDKIAKYRISNKKKIFSDFVPAGKDYFPSYKPEFMCSTGKEILKVESIDEVQRFLLFIKENFKICESCGEKFYVKSKSQTNFCKECYKNYRKQMVLEAVRKSRQKNRM